MCVGYAKNPLSRGVEKSEIPSTLQPTTAYISLSVCCSPVLVVLALPFKKKLAFWDRGLNSFSLFCLTQGR